MKFNFLVAMGTNFIFWLPWERILSRLDCGNIDFCEELLKNILFLVSM
jgi:hypothetical protein